MASFSELRSLYSGGEPEKKKGSSWLPNLGLSELVSMGKSFVPGVARLATSFAPGGTPAGEPWSQLGRGVANSALQTGGRALTALPELATFGKSNFGTSELSKAAEFLAGDDPNMQEAFKRSVGWQSYRERGIVPSAIEDIGNVALAGGAAAKAAKLGTTGRAAAAVTTAETAAKAGFSADDIAAAAAKVPGANARALSKIPFARGRSNAAFEYAQINPKLRAAAAASVKAPEAGAVDAASIASRAGKIRVAERFAHPYKAAFGEVLRPLGRAAQESVAPATAAEKVAEAAPEAPVAPTGTPPTPGPAQLRIERNRMEPVPEWAKALVEKTPEPGKRLLSNIEGRAQAGEYRAVDREQRRVVQSKRREVMLDPDGPVQASVKAAKTLKGLKRADGTRISAAEALAMVGGEIFARGEGRVAVADMLKEVLPESRHAAIDESFKLGDRIPAELRTPQLDAAIDNAIAKFGKLSDESLDLLLGSRKGDEGLTDVGSTTAKLTKGQKKLARQIGLAKEKTPKLQAAEARQFAVIERRLAAASAKMRRLGMESERLGELRDAAEEMMEVLTEGGFPLDNIASMTLDEIARVLPKVPGETERATLKRARDIGRNLERAKALDERQTQVVRNLAAVKAGRDALKADMEGGRLATSKALAKHGRSIASKERKLERLLDSPSVRRVPDHYKPIMGGYDELAKVAKDDAVMAHALMFVPEKFREVQAHLKANGVEPMHFASLTERDVRRLLYDPVKLSEAFRAGKTQKSGQRAVRLGAFSRTRTVEALAAAHVDAVLEPAANQVVDFMEKNIARDIPEGWGLKEMEDAGFIPWDAERTFILTGSKGEINPSVSGEPTKMVPKQVGTAIKHMSGDYSHSVWGMPKKITNGWRSLVLTWSPRWYFNNFLGNVVLATTGGVRLDDWLAAYTAIREGKDAPNKLDRAVAWARKHRRRSYSPTDVAPEGVAGIGGMSLYSDLGGQPTLLGEGGLRQGSAGKAALDAGRGPAGAVRASFTEASRRMQRGNEVVDDFARVAVYLSGKRRGMSAAEALNAAHTTLVDYQDLSPFERQVVRSLVPFYAWQKGMLKVVAKFPVDHPIAASVALQLGALQDEQWNPDMPDAYKQIIDVPGLGPTNTRGLNPFQDSLDMITPQGLINGINPFVDIALRNAYGAPEGGFTEHMRVNELGQSVPTTSPAQDVAQIGSSLPQYQLLGGLGVPGVGTYEKQKTGTAAVERFVGVPTYTEDDIERFKERMRKSGRTVSKFNG